MLYLYTGLPGSKKTANVVHRLTTDPLFKDRPIYYFNLKGCQIENWHEISETEAKAWYELPEGSVIFFDEAQKLYRPQKWDKGKPEYYTQLEEHRHKGIDIFLTTQHPMFIDTHVRRLVDEHVHLHNAFGIRSYSYTWPRCKDDPDNAFFEADKKSANVPKKTFSLYTSTVVNTNKPRIPKKLYIIAALAAFVFGAFGYLYQRFTPDRENIPVSDAPAVSSSPLSAVASLTAPPATQELKTPEQFAAQFIPRIPAIPWSAPAYDHLMTPTEAPRPHCVSFERANHVNKGCRCWTQQMTTLDIPYQDCLKIVHDGLFDPAPRVQTADFNSSGQPTHFNGRPQNLM